MAVTFYTSNPQKLLKAFNDRIDQSEPEGKITTWERSNDKKFFTHKAHEWTKKAWFMPMVEEGKLVFYIIKPKNQDVTVTVYGYYHGHLTETFLNHFDDLFISASSSARPFGSDLVANPK